MRPLPASRPRLGHARRRLHARVRDALPRPVYDGIVRRSYDARALVGRNPGRGRLLPDFVVIGAAKAGTTTLYGWLSEHPFVAPATTKEVHYFDYGFHRGVDWYLSHFPTEGERRAFEQAHGRPFLTGEASPSYMSHRWAPERLARLLPDAKLIVALRNPVDRAYSQFQMSRREGEEPLTSFEEALEQEEQRLRPEYARLERDQRYNSWPIGCWGYALRSSYADQIERWFELFPREQFLFVRTEDMASAPYSVHAEIERFLGLPEHRPERLPHLHTAEYEPLDPEMRARVAGRFSASTERLQDLLGRDFGWDLEPSVTA